MSITVYVVTEDEVISYIEELFDSYVKFGYLKEEYDPHYLGFVNAKSVIQSIHDHISKLLVSSSISIVVIEKSSGDRDSLNKRLSIMMDNLDVCTRAAKDLLMESTEEI